MPEIVFGARVTLHLRLSREDGVVLLDTAAEGEPLVLTLGGGALHRNLELALIGVPEGGSERLWLRPDQHFGEHDPELLHRLPLKDFSEPPQVGQVIAFAVGEGGGEAAGTVVAVEGEAVEVDFNHPAAGHPLLLEAAILTVEPPPAAG